MAPKQQWYGLHHNQVIRAAREAGDAILQHLASPESLGTHAKSDNSPVTKADLAADAIIREHLSQMGLVSDSNTEIPSPIPIMSEEMPLEEQQRIMKQGTYWCVDPLDGTKTAIAYADGKREETGFGVLIGLVKNGKPVFGVAHYPAQGPVVDGVPQGLTYFTNTETKKACVRVGPDEGRDEPIDAQARMYGPFAIAAGYRGASPQAIGGRTAENRPDVGGSRIIRAAEGKVDIGYMGNDGAVSFGFWDLAAPHAILRAAGGEMVTTPGVMADHAHPDAFKQSEPLRYDGTHFSQHPEAGEGKPYLPGCMAAHRDTLRSLGVPQMQAGRRKE